MDKHKIAPFSEKVQKVRHKCNTSLTYKNIHFNRRNIHNLY